MILPVRLCSEPWFSNCSAWVSDISIPQELVRNKFLGPAPDLLSQKLCGWGPAVCGLSSPPGGCDAHFSWRTTELEKCRCDLWLLPSPNAI